MVLAGAIAAGCAEAPPPPPPEVKAPELGFTVIWESPRVIRVTGRAKGKYELAPLHCAAARRAQADGAETLEWIGGVAKEIRDGYEAVFVYEAVGADPGSIDIVSEPGETTPLSESGGGEPVASWFKYCDVARAAKEDGA